MIIHLFENDISQNARSKVPEILKQSTSSSPAATTLADIRDNLVQVLFNLDRHDEAVIRMLKEHLMILLIQADSIIRKA